MLFKIYKGIKIGMAILLVYLDGLVLFVERNEINLNNGAKKLQAFVDTNVIPFIKIFAYLLLIGFIIYHVIKRLKK